MIFLKMFSELLGKYIYQTNLVEIIHGEGGGGQLCSNGEHNTFTRVNEIYHWNI